MTVEVHTYTKVLLLRVLLSNEIGGPIKYICNLMAW